MRLIDADAYKAKMKEKQDECAKWRDEAKARQLSLETERPITYQGCISDD